MSRRPPEQRYDGWRCAGDVLRELVEKRPELGITLPDDPPAPNQPQAIARVQSSVDARRAQLTALASQLRLAASATRGLVSTFPLDLALLPTARAGAEMEKWRSEQLDWAAWFDERADEAERAANDGGET